MYIIGQHKVNESVNITFDDTKLPSIQTEDAFEKLKFNNLSDPNSHDDDTQPVVFANFNDDNNDNDQGDGGGNIGNNGESTSTGEESLTHPGNNSGGDNEGLTSHSQHHNVLQGESSSSVPPKTTMWSIDHPFELIIGDLDVGVRTRSVTQNECLYSVFLSKMEPKKIEKTLTDQD